MKTAFEIIGLFIVSLFCISIPVLCTLSFAYDWFAGCKIFLIMGCLAE